MPTCPVYVPSRRSTRSSTKGGVSIRADTLVLLRPRMMGLISRRVLRNWAKSWNSSTARPRSCTSGSRQTYLSCCSERRGSLPTSRRYSHIQDRQVRFERSGRERPLPLLYLLATNPAYRHVVIRH